MSQSVNSGSSEPKSPESVDFIRAMVAEDLRTGKYGGRVSTRFPPEPNGFLHIGHAKSICLNFGIAAENEGGTCNLRFDDTNPITEEDKYAKAIQDDVRWLGYDWEDRLYYASDYFEKFYQYAVKLVSDGKAYVDSLSEEEIREYRGTVTQPGRESPYHNRSIAENLDLLKRMRAGEFPNGAHVLRAKIDMASPNMLMRDPLLYRIRHAHHYRTGDAWCIYPMYDFAHCLEDAIEKITHSLCTLEFKDNRALYDWVLQNVEISNPPEQTEFARLNIEYTVLSKRKLIRLVEEKHVAGWDDPRMPTIAGLRRRGVTPAAIRNFCDMIGVAKVDSRVDMGKLEFSIRDDLNKEVPRVMCVLQPLRVVITNYPEDQTEWLEAPYYPHDVPKEGSRKVPFSKVLYVEREDFREDPPKNYYRLAPGREVRLRYGYFIKCTDAIKDEVGEVTELHCTYDPATKGGSAADGRKVMGTIHWVSAEHSLKARVRLYDRLFTVPNPDDVPEGQDFTSLLNPDSLVQLQNCRIEPSVADDPPGARYQFERQGYFCSDMKDSSRDRLVFNRTVTLRDTWAKIVAQDRVPASPSAAPHQTKPSSKRDAPQGAAARQRVKVGTPEHEARIARYTTELGLGIDEANLLADNRTLSHFFDEAVAACADPALVANWVINDLLHVAKNRDLSDISVTGAQFGALVRLVADGSVSRASGKEVLTEMVRTGEDPQAIVTTRGLRQLTRTDELADMVGKVLDSHPDEVLRYRKGKRALLGFFVGQVMKQSGGKAKPSTVRELVERQLGE
ncbi:MAG: glutamine--tRNA ligase/YqeY domain fusion protein [Gemmatimonadota bacterium]|nr:MAG: glutamine--tRNA ligase/YqeY domain fusion protein [Gemmatimonadota bacterium]